MKCPVCNKEAITFNEWRKGTKAFKTNCNSCGTKLKSNFITNAMFVSMLLLLIPVIIYIVPQSNSLVTKFFVIVPIALIGSGLTWFAGGYDEDK